MPSTSVAEGTCPHCGRELPTYRVPAAFGAPERTLRGECGCEAAVAERARSARDARTAQLRTAWERTGVPAHYLGVEPDATHLATLEAGRGLYLWGPRGAGKTHAACRLLKAWVARHTSAEGWCSARFLTTVGWLDGISATYGTRASAEEAYQRAAGARVLVLDDLGKLTASSSAHAVGKIFRLVDDRCTAHRPTVFTSQYDLARLAERLTAGADTETPDAIVSRVFESCEQVRLDGPDRRLHGRP